MSAGSEATGFWLAFPEHPTGKFEGTEIEHHIFDGLRIADSAIGYTHAYPGVAPYHGDYTSKVINSLFVGETDNKGTPKSEAEIAYGRTLPRADADYPLRGCEYYDFLHSVVNTKFVNFQDNATCKAGRLRRHRHGDRGGTQRQELQDRTDLGRCPV